MSSDIIPEDFLHGTPVEGSAPVAIQDVVFFDTTKFIPGILSFDKFQSAVAPVLSEDGKTVGYASIFKDHVGRLVGSMRLNHNSEERLLLENKEKVWPEADFEFHTPVGAIPAVVTNITQVVLRRSHEATPWRPYLELMELEDAP